MGNKATRQVKKGGKLAPNLAKYQSPFGPKPSLRDIRPWVKS